MSEPRTCVQGNTTQYYWAWESNGMKWQSRLYNDSETCKAEGSKSETKQRQAKGVNA